MATRRSILLPIVILLSAIYLIGSADSSAVVRRPAPTTYLKASCSATQYPALCIQSLSVYSSAIQRNPQQLAQAALSVSLARARSAESFVWKLAKMKGMRKKEYSAVKDCLDNMGDTVDRLSKSVKELGDMSRVGARDFMWHMSNVQTWVSAALTNENTCVDGFAGRDTDGRVKAAVKSRVVNVAQVTSNALALINRFASRHRG